MDVRPDASRSQAAEVNNAIAALFVGIVTLYCPTSTVGNVIFSQVDTTLDTWTQICFRLRTLILDVAELLSEGNYLSTFRSISEVCRRLQKTPRDKGINKGETIFY